jgi:cytochrome c-type biogenesis protein CcmH
VTAFFVVAAAMLVAAIVLILMPLLRRRPADGESATAVPPATTMAVIAALALPITAGGLYLGITSYPWRAGPPAASAPATQPMSIEGAIQQLEARLATNPDDATGWRMLGRSLVVVGQFARAVQAYEKASALTPGAEPALALDLAEALVLTDDSALQSRAKQIVDGVLDAEPTNQKALWYSGVIALRASDPATAKQRFTALLAQDPPAEIRGILETQLAALGGPAAATRPTAAAGGAGAAIAPRGRTIRVSVTVDPALAARVKPGVPVFVSARQPGIPGPPLAAVRLASEALPTTVELSDANAMIEGRNLSSVDEVEITARIAFGGTAMTTPGDLLGKALRRGVDPAPLAIVIDTQAH